MTVSRKNVSNAKLLPVARSEKNDRTEVADRLHSAAIHLLRYARKQDVLSREGPARLSALSVLVFGGGPMTLGATGGSGTGQASDHEPDRSGTEALRPGQD